MTRLLYDSIDASLIPQGAGLVAGYGDGIYMWTEDEWMLHMAAVELSIVVSAQDQGDILDVEKGDATPAEVPGWVDRYDRPVFKVPTVYVNRGNWQAVVDAAGTRKVDYWVSTLDGTTYVPGAAAVQYLDAGGYDLSICAEWWPRIPPQPDPMPGSPAHVAAIVSDS